MIRLGFEEQNWKISLKWALRLPLFGKEWNWFVENAKIVIGDTIIFQMIDEPLRFKLCIFEGLVNEAVDVDGMW